MKAQTKKNDRTILESDRLKALIKNSSDGFVLMSGSGKLLYISPEDHIRIIKLITKIKQAEKNLAFLAQASKTLSSSLDYNATFANVAKLAVPSIADWCTIDKLNENNTLQSVAVVHKDPKKVKWAKEYRKKYPPDLNEKVGIANVLKTGKAEMYPVITDEMLSSSVKTKKQRQLIRSLGLTSVMLVPIIREGKAVGVISFVSTESRRRYNGSDLSIASEIASRASLAIQNATLYQNATGAVKLRDDFMSVASHELKTPITSLKIFPQILKEKLKEPQMNPSLLQHVGKMDEQINRLIELIYNLLDISRIQAGRIEFTKRLFAFDQMIQSVVDIFQQGRLTHKVLILGKTGKKVYGDEDRITQVVSNLITNAIKYSPSANKIIIRLTSKKNSIIVSVEDFGIGIEKNEQKKIFQRFFRGAKNTTFPGLGIGLYISSEIIRRHEGDLWVESDVGKGSTFFFSLPFL